MLCQSVKYSRFFFFKFYPGLFKSLRMQLNKINFKVVVFLKTIIIVIYIYLQYFSKETVFSNCCKRLFVIEFIKDSFLKDQKKIFLLLLKFNFEY